LLRQESEQNFASLFLFGVNGFWQSGFLHLRSRALYFRLRFAVNFEESLVAIAFVNPVGGFAVAPTDNGVIAGFVNPSGFLGGFERSI
jgi:hypothetical protein